MQNKTPSPYVYRKKFPRLLAALFDRMEPIFGLGGRRSNRTRPTTFRRIAVLRLDQIGDVTLAIPFLNALKDRYPEARILFVTTPSGRELLKSAKDAGEVRVWEAPWFAGRAGIFRALTELGALLRDFAPDAIVDLRGDVRHLWAARRAAPNAWIEGYGITGGGFLADRVPPYAPETHAMLKNFAFLGVAQPASVESIPQTPLALAALRPEVSGLLPDSDYGRVVAFHVGAGTDSKRWPSDSWRRLAERLSRETETRILWIGDRDAAQRSERLVGQLDQVDRKRSTVIGPRLSLGELNTFLRRCDLLVTHDSGPAHVAATVQIPTLVLFSEANRPSEWRPVNPHARVLAFPVENPLGPDEVFEIVRSMLRK